MRTFQANRRDPNWPLIGILAAAVLLIGLFAGEGCTGREEFASARITGKAYWPGYYTTSFSYDDKGRITGTHQTWHPEEFETFGIADDGEPITLTSRAAYTRLVEGNRVRVKIHVGGIFGSRSAVGWEDQQ